MDEFSKAAGTLIAALELANPGRDTLEGRTLSILKQMVRAVDSRNRSQMQAQFMVFKHFWLESVPWCSGLSRELEKLVMIYEESTHFKR